MNDQSDMPSRGELIERKIDKAAAGEVTVGHEFGGLRIQNMLEVMEMSKLMALSQQAVPGHLRNNPGMCLAVCLTALEWKMSPFAVANKTYVTNDRLNYESQLLHAIIEARAPLKERLRCRYEGEGDDLVCIVSGTFKGETEPREHRSPKLKEVRPRTNDHGQVKGSPLWTKKPAVQMFYDTSRDFCRIYCPDTILGIYTPDEVEQYGIGDHARDVTDKANGLHERLAAAAGSEGFQPGVVDAGLNGDADPSATPGGPVAGQSHDPATPGGRKKRAPKPAQPTTTEGIASPAPAQENAPAASPGPAQTIPEKVTSTLPKTPEEYLVYAQAWLQQATSADGIDERWRKERNLRNAIGLVEQQRAPLEAQKTARMQELGK